MKAKTLIYVNIRPYKVERLVPIYTAKRMGFKVVLLSDEDPGLDKRIIDDLLLVDTYNMEYVVNVSKEYAKTHRISGVLTWTDKDVELVAKIGEALSLPTISVDAAKNSRNKYLMRNTLMNRVADLCPDFRRVTTYDHFKKAVDKLGYPGIFKPVGASGSKNIFKIERDTNLHEMYETMVESTSPVDDKIYSYYPNEYIYEEYLNGPEVSVDGLVQNGTVYITGVADNLVTEDFSLDYLEIFPSEKSDETIGLIKDGVNRTITALEFNNCSFHLEGRLTSDGFKIIEVAGRPGGGFLATHVIGHAAGISYLEFIIKVATGENIEDSWVDFDTISTRSVCHYEVISKKEGVVDGLHGLDDVIEDENVIVIVPLRNIGDRIFLPPKDFETCYLATTILKGNNFKEVQKTIQRLENKLNYIINEE